MKDEKKTFPLLSALLSCVALSWGCASAPQVTFAPGPNRIDVLAGGRLLASYRFGEELAKPVLYPIRAPSGDVVTRAFPLGNAPGESRDHPHHVGLFFTYDQVNGEGFWRNAAPPPRIEHVKVTKLRPGAGAGTLAVLLRWRDRKGEVLLEERRAMVFSAGGDEPGRGEYGIDFTITLTARDKKVVFKDTKEGMFAIRVAPWLKERGGTGRYLSSNGDETEKNVWGKRARWVRLEGERDGRTIGIAILNHPESVNYPTFWHARGYGLFAANPLGQAVFEKARGAANPRPLNLTLEPGQSALFKFRVIVYEGKRTAKEIEERFAAYAGGRPTPNSLDARIAIP